MSTAHCNPAGRLWTRLRLLALLLPTAALAAPTDFNVPAQAADAALLAFSQQSREEVFFSLDDLRGRQAQAVAGRLEPEEALQRLLAGTGFTGTRNQIGRAHV